MSKHTDGPIKEFGWRYYGHEMGEGTKMFFIRRDGFGRILEEKTMDQNMSGCADELLEACKEALRALAFNRGRIYDHIKQAIDKAEGRA